MAAGLTPFSRLNRAFTGTQLIIMWERILPALVPFVLWVGLVAVAGQWGVFARVSGLVHAGILAAGAVAALFFAARNALSFKAPSFTEINTRLALDNGLKPERLLAMRHEVVQPPLKIAKARAGVALGDPFAIRFVIVLAAVFGFVFQGPVPAEQVASAFCPCINASSLTLAALDPAK
jgi:hypothetical protein